MAMNELELEEQAHGHTIDQRDAMERAFSDAYELVMGKPMEWSSAYNTAQALRDMDLSLRRERTQRQSK